MYGTKIDVALICHILIVFDSQKLYQTHQNKNGYLNLIYWLNRKFFPSEQEH